MVDLRSIVAALAGWIRQMAARIALRVVDRLETVGLTAAERAWPLNDVYDDLRVQIEDAERLSISALGARTMMVTRSVADWLEQGDPLGEAGSEEARFASTLTRTSPAPLLSGLRAPPVPPA